MFGISGRALMPRESRAVPKSRQQKGAAAMKVPRLYCFRFVSVAFYFPFPASLPWRGKNVTNESVIRA